MNQKSIKGREQFEGKSEENCYQQPQESCLGMVSASRMKKRLSKACNRFNRFNQFDQFNRFNRTRLESPPVPMDTGQ